MTVSPEFLTNKALQLVAVMAESLIVGSYFIIVILICQLLLTRYQHMPLMHRLLFFASILMFFVSVVHVGLVIQELTREPIPKANGQAQVILSVVQFVTGDLILIWRLWTIWERNLWIIIVPLILLTGAAGTSLSLLATAEKFFTVAPVALLVANTSICTTLIAGRVWYIHKRSIKNSQIRGPTRWKGTVILLVESGTLYTSIQLLSLILSYTQSVALPVLLNLEIPLIGILPSLIIIVVHFDLRSVAAHPEVGPRSNITTPTMALSAMSRGYSSKSTASTVSTKSGSKFKLGEGPIIFSV